MGKRVALFVWGDVRLGGAERRFFRLFNHLHENGYSVYLYTSECGVAACESLGIRLDGKHMHVFPEPDKSSPRLRLYLALIGRAVRLVWQARRDRICHLHFGENPGALTFLYALVARLACPFSVSLVNSTKAYQRSARNKLYVIFAARFSSCVDCLSSQIKTDLISFIGKRYEQKFLVSPCSFTDLEAAAPARVGAEDGRDIDISIVARMTSGKGHMLLKDALIELGRLKRTGLIVHVCGSGPLEPQIRREFQRVEGQRIHIHFEQDPFRTLRRTKVYVSLQDTENYPSQSLLEAMASGCAIVATDVGLTRRLLDESCAVLVPRHPVALAEAFQKLLDQGSLRAELGRRAQDVVVGTQTIERFAGYFVADVFGCSPLHGSS